MLWGLAQDDPRPTQRQRQEPSPIFEDSPSQVAFIASSPEDGVENRQNRSRQSHTIDVADAAAREIDAAACVHGSMIANRSESSVTSIGNRIDDRAAGPAAEPSDTLARAADRGPLEGTVCVTCGRCCACHPVRPPANYPPLTTWATSRIHALLSYSELDAAKALQWCIARIDEVILANPTRYKIGMTGDVESRWSNAYNGIYDDMHVLHAMRSKDCAFMLEASLIELYSHFDRPATKLVNLENRDRGGTGRPQDDVLWYYVYIVSYNAAGRLHPQFSRKRRHR